MANNLNNSNPNQNTADTPSTPTAKLEPEVVITGHGPALQGPEMRVALHELADRFEVVAIPPQGRYVNSPGLPK